MKNPKYLKVLESPESIAAALEASISPSTTTSSETSETSTPPTLLPHWLAQPYVRPPPPPKLSKEETSDNKSTKLEKLERPIETNDLQAEDEKRNGMPEVLSEVSSSTSTSANVSNEDLNSGLGKRGAESEGMGPPEPKKLKVG